MRHRRFFPTFDSLSLRIAPSGMDAAAAADPSDGMTPPAAVAPASDPSDPSDPTDTTDATDPADATDATDATNATDPSQDQGTDSSSMYMTMPDMTPYSCAIPIDAANPYIYY